MSLHLFILPELGSTL